MVSDREYSAKKDWCASIVIVLLLGFVCLLCRPIWSQSVGPMETQNRRTCMSNLNQLSFAMLQYVQDYDDKFPDGLDHWAGQIYPYAKSTAVYHCPDDATDASANSFACSYAMNANLKGESLAALNDPSATALFVDIDGSPLVNMTKPERKSLTTIGLHANTAWGGIRLGVADNPNNTARHDGRIVVAQTNGTVRLLKPSSVSSGHNSSSEHGAQDAAHAAGTAAVGSRYAVTFSLM